MLASVVAQLTTEQCLNQCQTDFPLIGGQVPRPAPCCNCCNSTSSETCHEIAEFLTCCSATQAFCGCLSSRAFCLGGIFNSTEQVNTFGTCYDPTDPGTGTCCYDPSPNFWRVCPQGGTCCISASQMGCCAADEECASTRADPEPICRKKGTNPSPSSSPSPREGSCQGCGTQSCCVDVVHGGLCFNPETHKCLTATPTGNVLCGLLDEACGSICFNPMTHKCVTSGNSPVLCGREYEACGTACYDPSMYKCCSDNRIAQLTENC